MPTDIAIPIDMPLQVADRLESMAEEDAAGQEPADLDALDEDERIAYYVYHLRDTATMPWSTHKTRLCGPAVGGLHGSLEAANTLRGMGKPAVPALIGLLDDSRPLRSYSRGTHGYTVLQYRDAAAEILSAIAGQQFIKGEDARLHLSQLPKERQEQVEKAIGQWWQANRERTETQWLREAIAREGIGRLIYWDDRADRLIALQGLESVDFFRERVAAEPGSVDAIRVFWQAATSDGPADPGVLAEVRALRAREHGKARAEAYRILLENGTAKDRKEVTLQLRKEIQAGSDLESWSAADNEHKHYPDEMIALLCRQALPESFEIACKMLYHDDRRVVMRAADELCSSYRPAAAEQNDPAMLRQLTRGLLVAMGDRPGMEGGPIPASIRYEAAIWIIAQHQLKLDLPLPPKADGTGNEFAIVNDADKESVIKQVLAWGQARAVDNPENALGS